MSPTAKLDTDFSPIESLQVLEEILDGHAHGYDPDRVRIGLTKDGTDAENLTRVF